MAWTLDEAFKQHITNKGRRVQNIDEITEEKITDADRHILDVCKKTEGMSDSERIRHIHNAIAFIQPFMSKFPAASDDEVKRLAKLSKTLKEAYCEYCKDSWEKPTKKILTALKTLNFFKLNADDWYDILETVCTNVSEEDYDTDIHDVKKIAEFLYYLELSKGRFAKDI
jgi:hypothetical protein